MWCWHMCDWTCPILTLLALLCFAVWRSNMSQKPVHVRYVHNHTHDTHGHTVHFLPPGLKGAQRGFVGLRKRPRKMFSEKLFTIHNPFWAKCCMAPCDASHLHFFFISYPLLLSSFPPPLNHSLRILFSSLCLSSFLPSLSLFGILRHWASHPQRRTRFSGKLSLIMVAINNMS